MSAKRAIKIIGCIFGFIIFCVFLFIMRHEINFKFIILIGIFFTVLLLAHLYPILKAEKDKSLGVKLCEIFPKILTPITIVVGLLTFYLQYWPILNVVAINYESQANYLIFKVKNFSNVALEDVQVKYVIFENKIENGVRVEPCEAKIIDFSLSEEEFPFAPQEEKNFLIDLNLLHKKENDEVVTIEDFNKGDFIHGVFLIRTSPLWMLPVKNYTRAFLYNKKENYEWIEQRKDHPELVGIFRYYISCLKDRRLPVAKMKYKKN